jgi:hypothetical protein
MMELGALLKSNTLGAIFVVTEYSYGIPVQRGTLAVAVNPGLDYSRRRARMWVTRAAVSSWEDLPKGMIR